MKERICQGRIITQDDMDTIRDIIHNNPDWNRTRISKELCKKWDWYTPYGQLKDMACRTLLLKLHRANLITLPPSLCSTINSSRGKKKVFEPHDRTPVNTSLSQLKPLSFSQVKDGYALRLFKTYLQHYHYLGLRTTVGENLKYMVYDRDKRPLACLLFGAAAWKVAPRDNFIGWPREVREVRLSFIAGNNRFLILPWVRVPHLASHILGQISKRISGDWQEKYAHPIYLLESFIQKDRFTGTCYKASNWLCVGDTQGRGKNDFSNKYPLPVKSIWLYPLIKNFKRHLRGI
jgi:hypothetical protein